MCIVWFTWVPAMWMYPFLGYIGAHYFATGYIRPRTEDLRINAEDLQMVPQRFCIILPVADWRTVVKMKDGYFQLSYLVVWGSSVDIAVYKTLKINTVKFMALPSFVLHRVFVFTPTYGCWFFGLRLIFFRSVSSSFRSRFRSVGSFDLSQSWPCLMAWIIKSTFWTGHFHFV